MFARGLPPEPAAELWPPKAPLAEACTLRYSRAHLRDDFVATVRLQLAGLAKVAMSLDSRDNDELVWQRWNLGDYLLYE